jgi:hypothetical protein
MIRALTVSVCALALLLAGCGGNGDAAKRKTACANAKAAYARYTAAGGAVGLDFFNRTKDLAVVDAAGAFRARVLTLAPLTSESQRRQLEGLARALALHKRILSALAAHRVPLVRKLTTPAFEKELHEGRANFEKVCAKSASS